jgi:asparaginyl-tRNA synthetase
MGTYGLNNTRTYCTSKEAIPMRRTRVIDALHSQAAMPQILVKGWVRTRRDAKGFSFLELNDGSCLKNLQVIVDTSALAQGSLTDASTGAAVEVEGALVESPGKGQRWEVQATQVRLVGAADPETYPLQKKRHTDEFLRSLAHLRPRTNKYGALLRIRSESAFAVHNFSGIGAFIISTPRSLPARTVKALAPCLA